MSNSYIMLMTNINMEFRHLVGDHDALLKNNWNFFDEKQDLKAIINWFKIANEQDSKTIKELN